MRRIIFSLLLVCSPSIYAENSDFLPEEILSPIQVSQIFDKNNSISDEGLINLFDKEDKIGRCVEDYIKTQSRTYAKIVQNNLYDLIHNFDKIASRIYGKRSNPTDITHEEKIEALAKIQCEAYYTIGVLK